MIAVVEAYRAGLFARIHWLPNLIAGLVVGIVALPLAMAFVIASGARPEQGIYTAINDFIEPKLKQVGGDVTALRNKGVRLGAMGRNEEAIAVYDDLLSRFGAATEPALREQVAAMDEPPLELPDY